VKLCCASFLYVSKNYAVAVELLRGDRISIMRFNGFLL